jgi:hypothetical protein
VKCVKMRKSGGLNFVRKKAEYVKAEKKIEAEAAV